MTQRGASGSVEATVDSGSIWVSLAARESVAERVSVVSFRGESFVSGLASDPGEWSAGTGRFSRI